MNFLKRCWQKRWLRRLTWIVVTLTALIASLYAWVNWSGARQLRNVEAMLKAEGETLDFRKTLNEPVPEAENFCAIPLLKDVALIVDNDANKGAPGENRKRLEAMRLPSSAKGVARPPKYANAAIGKHTDFKAWADFLRKEGSLPMPVDSGDAARDVLTALSKYDAIVQELAAGLNRPKAQWTPEWKTRELLPEILFEIESPHFSSIMAVNRTLSFHAAVAARIGDAAKAQEAALIIARMTQAALNEPFVIGLLVGVLGAEMLHDATWELCTAHAGTAEDFARLEVALTALDVRSATLRAYRSEMTAGVNAIQLCKRKPENLQAMFSPSWMMRDFNVGVFSHIPERAFPSGLLDASAAVLAEQEFKNIIKPLRDEGWSSLFKAAQDWEKDMDGMKKHVWMQPCYIIVALTSPAFTSFINMVIFIHTQVNQAIIACALERYRIEKGSYPDSLDAVRLADDKPLPLDPIHEKPMGYRKTADGRYALWSVGFDGKDDGGKRTLNDKKPENTQFHKADYVGDWVWDFPAE